jgi:molybdopterin converting factor small subunit
MYGPLKKFFPERLDMELSDGRSVIDLRRAMIRLSPEAEPLLNACRAATEERFLDEEETLVDGCGVHILPPASGG